jgi:hypothetical protein
MQPDRFPPMGFPFQAMPHQFNSLTMAEQHAQIMNDDPTNEYMYQMPPMDMQGMRTMPDGREPQRQGMGQDQPIEYVQIRYCRPNVGLSPLVCLGGGIRDDLIGPADRVSNSSGFSTCSPSHPRVHSAMTRFVYTILPYADLHSQP